jgi:hypothetical protein
VLVAVAASGAKNSTRAGEGVPHDLSEARARVLACLASRAGDVPTAQESPVVRYWTADVVAEDMGVATRRVGEIMGTLERGVHVVEIGERLVATESGREKIRTMLDAAMAGERRAAAPTIRKARPAGIDLRVTRKWCEKRVLCVRVDNGLEVICRVQSSVFLLPGMVIPGAVRGQDGVFSFYGRLPRRKGRW